MQFLHRDELAGTDRSVRHANYDSVRLLLARDGYGLSVTDITLRPGIEGVYGLADRTEIAYCIGGAATVHDLDSGAVSDIRPGSLWIAPPGSRFAFVAQEPTRLICVFTPALDGDETGLAAVDTSGEESRPAG